MFTFESIIAQKTLQILLIISVEYIEVFEKGGQKLAQLPMAQLE